MKKTTMAIVAIILLSFAIGIALYDKMPEQMASHWNAKGEVDDYMSKFWGLFLMPIISVAILLLFLAIPVIDPLKKNIKKFRGYFDMFMLAIILFLFYIYLISIAWNLDYRFSMTQMIAPAIGILLFCAGILIQKAKRNWFIGIRTPWTLSDDRVWKKTHKIGAKLFKISGVIAFAAIFLENYAVWLIAAPVIASSVFLIVYSYFLYQKLHK